MKLLSTLLLFQDISGGELILVLLAVFLLFGPNKIPELAKGLAKGLSNLKKATGDIREEVDKAIDPIKKELQGHADTLKESLGIDDKPQSHDKSMKNNKTGEKPAG
ncbi:MAG: twin-arginine translocase TatA/TatE family subunit [Bacteroidota bacterium]